MKVQVLSFIKADDVKILKAISKAYNGLQYIFFCEYLFHALPVRKTLYLIQKKM